MLKNSRLQSLKYQLISSRNPDVLAARQARRFIKKNFKNAPYFTNRELLWDFVFDNYLNSDSGLLAEFGVWEGYSINFFSRKRPNWKCYGLDSFYGLEEAWVGNNWEKGAFSVDGLLPFVEGGGHFD
jgi:hypothetical protein